MASAASVCRHATRVKAPSRFVNRIPARDFTSSPRRWAASNFVMPALSPTMTEGNIASWKVKEGDSFSAGDVLLEVETDKAQMDVEAQEDGVMAKIMQKDGTKSIRVGTRIAVLGESGDDVSSLEMPPEPRPDKSSADKSTSKPASDQTPEQSSPKQSQTPSKPSPSQTSQHRSDPPKSSESAQPQPNKQKYPLYPAVQHLMHQHGIPLEDASKIPASGPNGRLLKGDVLGYVGSIEKDYSSQQSQRLIKLGHLDLSKIKKAPSRQPEPAKDTAPQAEKPTVAPPTEVEPSTQIALPISLAAVFATQRRIQDSLGLTLPLSTFIARASEIANEALPQAKGTAASSDELFDAVLGLRGVKRTSRGRYVPQITSLPPQETAADIAAARSARGRRSDVDIMDLLSGTKPKVAHARPPPMPRKVPGAMGVAGADNVFSVDIMKGEEKRARTYLERVKSILEAEPGRCVL